MTDGGQNVGVSDLEIAGSFRGFRYTLFSADQLTRNVLFVGHKTPELWLADQDSNLDKEIQSLRTYH